MSEELLKYNFDLDLSSNELNKTIYVADDVAYTQCPDAANGTGYTAGFINFTNLNLLGNTDRKYFDWSEAYLELPYSFTLDLINEDDVASKYVFDTTKNWKYALAPKGYHHFIDQATIEFSGIACNRNAFFNNFYINEQLKQMNEDEKKVIGDIMNLSWDTGDTIDFVSKAVGEVNNRIINQNDFLASDMTRPNLGLRERLSRNTDFRPAAAQSSLAKIIGGTQATSNKIATNVRQNGIYSVTANKVIYVGTAIIPLKYVHDFYAKLPTISATTSFELRLQCNIAEENSWSVTYDASGAMTAVTSNQSVGRTCPVTLSQLSFKTNDGKDISGTVVDGGLPVKWASAKATGSAGPPAVAAITNDKSFTIKVTPSIGWKNVGLSGHPCRIIIPNVNFTEPYAYKITTAPRYHIKYTDFYVDRDHSSTARAPGSTGIVRPINVSLSNVRHLYILPFLSGTADTALKAVNTNVYQSLVSSAPTTVSPCKLTNFNIAVGGNLMLSSPLLNNVHFYKNNFMSLMSHVNGNSLKSLDFGGVVTKTMWEQGGYGTYVIDLKRVKDELGDAKPKSFEVMFDVQSDGTAYYDFVYIIDYESNLFIERVGGAIKSSMDAE